MECYNLNCLFFYVFKIRLHQHYFLYKKIYTHSNRGDHFRFGSVFIKKKVTKPILKKKTETEPKPVQTDRFRFGFLGQKPVQTDLARFWLGFFGLGSVWFFLFQAYKTETEPVGFFKILIGLISFFSQFDFFNFFILIFSV